MGRPLKRKPGIKGRMYQVFLEYCFFTLLLVGQSFDSNILSHVPKLVIILKSNKLERDAVVQDSASNGLGSSPGRCYCFLFLVMTLSTGV